MQFRIDPLVPDGTELRLAVGASTDSPRADLIMAGVTTPQFGAFVAAVNVDVGVDVGVDVDVAADVAADVDVAAAAELADELVPLLLPQATTTTALSSKNEPNSGFLQALIRLLSKIETSG